MSDIGAGEYFGRATRRIATDHLWLEVLETRAVRIVGLGLPDSDNILGETPDAGWDTPRGRYELLGGHRLWYAPETLSPGVPERDLEIEAVADGLRLTGPVEPNGLQRTMEIRLAAGEAAVSIVHRIANRGVAAAGLSVWAITQLPLGGTAFVPLPELEPPPKPAPNRHVALWPYASWRDDRLVLDDAIVGLRGRAGAPVKIGTRSAAGVAGYLRDGILIVKRFDPVLDAPHPDRDCNVEIYADGGTIELETLGPLVTLAPGDEAVHVERWELRSVDVRESDLTALRGLVLPAG